jgi:hypothetical protein
MRALAVFLIGLALGPLSWLAAQAVSGTFEPFDDGIGFLVCQVVLSIALFVVGLRTGVLRALLCLVGVWVGMNAYGYLAGSSEMRAWIVLLMFSSLSLLAFPLAAGVLGGAVRALRARRTAAALPPGR